MSERVWGIASYGLVGTAALAAGSYIAWRCEVDGSTIASWVQAIGSIGAIVGTMMAVRYQAAIAADERQDGIRAIVEAAKERADAIAVALKSGDRWQIGLVYNPLLFEGLIGALAGIPAQAVRSKEGVVALFSLQGQFDLLGKAVQELLGGPEMHSLFQKELQRYREEEMDRDELRELRKSMEQVLAHNVTRRLLQIDHDYSILHSALK